MDKKKQQKEYYPLVMTIGGSDSSGGAGIQADLRTFNALGAYGCSAVSAVVSSSPLKTALQISIGKDLLVSQIESVMQAMPVKYVKSEMLMDAESIKALAEAAKRFRWTLICDPMLTDWDGNSFLSDGAVEALKEFLFPAAAWIMPNLPEAEQLIGKKIVGKSALISAAAELNRKYKCNVVITGGKGSGREALDVVCCEKELYQMSAPRLELDSPEVSHGIGGTFSAAFTAALAMKLAWKDALREAKAFVLGSLREAVELSDQVQAMYPPTEDCIDFVKIAKVLNK